MPKTRFLARVGGFIEVFGAARRSAAALEAHRAPKARDLETFGVDAAAFKSIKF
ncbi:MAG: hypothetical protein ACYC0C_02175 [Devosia sp.]